MISNILNVLLFSQQPNQNPIMTMLPFLLIIVVFYFFMIRPQMKKQKDLKTFREALKNGDKIVTIGGIYGKIVETSDRTVIIEVEGKIRLKIDKSALIKDSSDMMQTGR